MEKTHTMEEDPKDHDFDQRHDGPFEAAQRPSIHIPRQDSSKSEPVNDKTPMSPDAARSPDVPSKTRKSVQIPRESLPGDEHEGVGRKSTQISHGRPSRDFDVRRDGPFGRPSITMARRRSSGVPGIGADETDAAHRDPSAPDIADLEALPTTGERLSFEPEPPPLNYSLWERKWWIVIFWSLILFDCIAMPIALYFGLWYGTNLSPNIVFSIVTAALGGVSIFEYFLRFWRLWKKGSTCRVIGARRMYLDWFHWNFTLGWVIIMIELIVGTVPKFPPIRLLAMPLTSMLYTFGTELLVMDTLRYFEIPAPCRVSSIPKGAQLRPAVYTLIEDVVAVDGSGGTAYREALNKRYESSHVFRAMLRRLGAFWAFGAETMAVVMTILIFTVDDEVAYVIGWSVPFVWAGVWVLITWLYVRRKLKEEQIAWEAEIAEKQGAMEMGRVSE